MSHANKDASNVLGVFLDTNLFFERALPRPDELVDLVGLMNYFQPKS